MRIRMITLEKVNKMKQKIKTFFNKYRYAVLSSLLFLGIELQMQILTGDETYYRNILNENSLIDNILYYYHYWSNRLLVDTVAMLILHMPMFVFKCINAFILFIGQIAIYKLSILINKDSCSMEIISLFTYLIPFSSFMDAGFSVTSIYYLWTLVAGLWAIYFAVSERKYGYYYILGPACTVFSCNMEQISILIVTVLVTYCVTCIVKRKRNLLCQIEGILSICMFGYMLLGPGAKYRSNVEAGKCFPEFGMLSITQKLDMGFSATMYHFLFEGDIIWLVLTALIMLLLYKKTNDSFYRLLGCLPFGLSVGLLLMQDMGKMIPGIDTLRNGVEEYGTIYLANFDMRCKWILLILFSLIVLVILIDFYLLFSFKPMFGICNVLFLVGFASRVVMGFSPTIYESGMRTYFLLWMCCIFISIHLIQTLGEQFKSRIVRIIFIFVIIQNCSFIYALS